MLHARFTSCVVVIVGSITLSASGRVSAEYIKNASFETPAIDDGKSTVCQFPGSHNEWTATGNSANWVFANSQAAYSGTIGSNPAKGADGANFLGINSNAGAATKEASWIYQNLDLALEVGKKYELTIAVGKRNTGRLPFDNFVLDLATTTGTVGTDYLAHRAGVATDLTVDQFTDFSVSYTAKAADAGKKLRVVFGVSTNSGHSYQETTDFDNVRLTVSSIPEPNAFIILASGLIGLLAYAWRKRR